MTDSEERESAADLGNELDTHAEQDLYGLGLLVSSEHERQLRKTAGYPVAA